MLGEIFMKVNKRLRKRIKKAELRNCNNLVNGNRKRGVVNMEASVVKNPMECVTRILKLTDNLFETKEEELEADKKYREYMKSQGYRA